jgi:hypothetical protein
LIGSIGFHLADAAAGPAIAHGFGQRYDLPLPLSFYVWGAGAVVAASFVAFSLFLRPEHEPLRRQMVWRPKGRLVTALVTSARALALAMLIVVIVAGLLGSPDPVRNLAPVMIWVVGWVGLAFLSLLLGDVWALINPWNTVFAAIERCARRIGPGALRPVVSRFPQWLGVWPAFVLFLVFAWMELVWSGKNVPAELAAALLIYSGLTLIGMLVFGRAAWLAHGEVFTPVFGTFARFGPLAPMADGSGSIRVRPPAVGLLEDPPTRISMVALVVALLATVTFDGLLETPLWAGVDLAVLYWAAEPSFLELREDQAVRLVRTGALLACVLVFFTAYAGVCALTAAAAGNRDVGFGRVLRSFVLTLVPIALAYHVAHYFSLFFIAGQYAIPLLSDPLGRGWNLLGTAGYRVNIGLVSAWLQWTVAVVAVVIGHVIAVYLSHVTALRVFGTGRAALVGQVPMVLLMVGYTMLSLWILSQPIVETGAG